MPKEERKLNKAAKRGKRKGKHSKIKMANAALFARYM